jgi:hypothetical protein
VGLNQLLRMLKQRQSQLDSQYSWLVPASADAQAAGVLVRRALVNSGTDVIEVYNPASFGADLAGYVCVPPPQGMTGSAGVPVR